MTEFIFDHDRLDVFRLSIENVGMQEVDYEHEHRAAEHEHEEMPEKNCIEVLVRPF